MWQNWRSNWHEFLQHLPFFTVSISVVSSFKTTPGTRQLLSAVIWFCCSAFNGLTTSDTPSWNKAGKTKHKLLPYPVGRMPMVSFPFKIDVIISICLGFNELGICGYFFVTISCWYVEATIVIKLDLLYTSDPDGAKCECCEVSN